jgi:hypothetical protein
MPAKEYTAAQLRKARKIVDQEEMIKHERERREDLREKRAAAKAYSESVQQQQRILKFISKNRAGLIGGAVILGGLPFWFNFFEWSSACTTEYVYEGIRARPAVSWLPFLTTERHFDFVLARCSFGNSAIGLDRSTLSLAFALIPIGLSAAIVALARQHKQRSR